MMVTEQNESSVIGKLMGLDVEPRRVYRQNKVFSEKYLQKSASIGSCESRLSKIRHRKLPKINKSLRNDYSFDEIENLKTNVKRTDYAETAILRPNLGNAKRGSIPSFLLDSRTVFGWEYKKQLLERSKRSKVCLDIWSSNRDCNVGETRSMEDLELKQKVELGTKVVYDSNEGWKDKSVTLLPILKRSSGSDIECKNMSKDDLTSGTGRGIYVSTNSENVAFSCSSSTSFEQDSTCEEGFTSLSVMDIDDELLRNTDEGFQPSPISVLEPDNFSSSEYGDISTDLDGLWMKLQVLVSESEENESKPEIVTLSDGDSTKITFCVSQNIKHSRCLGPKQSQQFSYLSNVLNELGFHGGKMEVSFERLHSPRHIINPLVFETLEKKYRKQKSWNRADRQLLFDRINIGLSEIVGSKPLSRKMCTFLRRDIIEDELWNMLLIEENEVNYELSRKALGKEPWLELGDEVDSIVEEIEEYLFNELATDLVAA
uniref:uncharacterized protein LOC122585054 n=1 Tax=Erigeron canadensis TaxID=72917 RepID=UPI001CB92623|nr:uncharacterized protein LOC122585054 [Erigeron canadensis]